MLAWLSAGPPGKLTVTIENRTDQPLSRGRYVLNGHAGGKPLTLQPPFSEVPPRRRVTGTFEDWSGLDVQFVDDVGEAKDRVVNCGYPDWGNSIATVLVAEGDNIFTRSIERDTVDLTRGSARPQSRP